MKYIILILLTCYSLNLSAQNRDSRDGDQRKKEMREKIKALAVAHITKELDLTAQEAEKFWPLYNQVHDEQHRLEKEKKKLMYKLETGLESMTESQALAYIDKMVTLDQKISAANLDYMHEDMIKVIGAKRFLKLKQAEIDFRRKMIREYRDRKNKD